MLAATFEYPNGAAEAIDAAIKLSKGEKVEKTITLGTAPVYERQRGQGRRSNPGEDQAHRVCDMSSLIEELQRHASQAASHLPDTLRKAKVVASKLDVPVVGDWIDRELQGYRAGDEIPHYRELHGTLKAQAPIPITG